MEINKKGGKLMKKLEIIIRPEKLEDLKDILTVSGVTGMMIPILWGLEIKWVIHINIEVSHILLILFQN
mgnify:CR=1 FL=1